MTDSAKLATTNTLILLVSLCLVCAPLLMKLDAQKHCQLIWQAHRLPKMCGFKLFTGHDCPGCGMTRCFVCMAHGDWVSGVKFHPWGAAFYLFLMAQIPYRLYSLYRIYKNQPALYFSRGTQYLCVFLALYFIQWFIRLAYGA